MTVEEIKKRIREAEVACVSAVYDAGHEADLECDVLVMDVYPKRNVKKALKELGIREYTISDDNTVTYMTWL